jgi:RNA polymerase II subunit A-like phosphatase
MRNVFRALFPCGDHLTAIIDDREDVWQYADNLVHVKPYRFFKHTGDINAPPQADKTDDNTEHQFQFAHPKPVDSSDEGRAPEAPKKQLAEGAFPDVSAGQEAVEDTDDYLIYLEDILTRVHTKFYEFYDEPRDSATLDLKTIIPYVKKKVLPGVRLVFSGVFPMNVRADTTQIYKMAQAFGAVVQTEIVSREQDETNFTTHVVAARWGTNKVNTASRLAHVQVVTPQWLWCCIERWEKVGGQMEWWIKICWWTGG